MAYHDNNEHDDEPHRVLIQRHRNRREVPWVPYQQRRSEGLISYRDEGAKVMTTIEVAGLGSLVVTALAHYSEALREFKWDRSAVLWASIKDDSVVDPDSTVADPSGR